MRSQSFIQSVQNNQPLQPHIQTLFNLNHSKKSTVTTTKSSFNKKIDVKNQQQLYYLSLCKPRDDLESISICCRLAIAQFIVDIYTQTVTSHQLTINEFMDKSNFLSNIPKHSKPWQCIRKHLTEYLKYIYKPINHKITPFHVKQISLSKILEYTSEIHNVLRHSSRSTFGVRDPYQLDTLFLTKSIHWINTTYLDKIGITKYMKWDTKNKTVAFGAGFKDETGKKLEEIHTISRVWRNFNNLMGRQEFKRFVMLIKCDTNGINDEDEIFIFEPLKHNKLPPELSKYTELPWICSSKSELFANIIPERYGVLGLSFHIHSDAERVYFSNGHCCGTRIFKQNMIDVLSQYCIRDKMEDYSWWKQEVKSREFEDRAYTKFVERYFPDL